MAGQPVSKTGGVKAHRGLESLPLRLQKRTPCNLLLLNRLRGVSIILGGVVKQFVKHFPLDMIGSSYASQEESRHQPHRSN